MNHIVQRPTQIKDKKRSGDEPVQVAHVEELPAPSNCGPALAREHGEVGESGHRADESVDEVVPVQGKVSTPIVSHVENHIELSYFLRSASALAALATITTEVTARARKPRVRAPTPVEPTSSMVVHAVGAKA